MRFRSTSTESAYPGAPREEFLITKGEAENVFAICQSVTVNGSPQPFDETKRAQAAAQFLKKLNADGYRTLGVAVARVTKQDAYTTAAEHDMTLEGFAAFLDPPKQALVPFWKH